MSMNSVCLEIKNFFIHKKDSIRLGSFSIVDGVISPAIPEYVDYIRIVGSHKNDGVHKRGDNGFDGLTNDTFEGAVWYMYPPQDFIDLVDEIDAWQTKYGGVDSTNMSPFQSESFGGYSYSKASSGSSSETASSAPTWQKVYANRLNAYRRQSIL
jgi:hypothetical protein